VIISNQQVQSILKNYGVSGGKRIYPSEAVSAPARQDKLELSPQAQEMQAVRQKIASLPDVRSDRVEQVKDQIKNGSYQVDSSAVAEKMLQRSLADGLMSKS
jgi:negative regulator of flagellin synthesis FlgM